MSRKQRDTQIANNEFASLARKALQESADRLDESTAEKLTAMRKNLIKDFLTKESMNKESSFTKIQQPPRTQKSSFATQLLDMLLPLGALASVLVVVSFLTFLNLSGQPEGVNVNQSTNPMLVEEELDLYEELDFYSWLAESNVI